MPEDAAKAMDEKEVKSAVEAVTAVRERMDSLEEKTEKIASLEAKMAALVGQGLVTVGFCLAVRCHLRLSVSEGLNAGHK